MQIDTLRLKNFRNFEDITFQLDQNFTAVIGINGKGKSSLLHGLRIAAGTYFLGIPDVKNRAILESEIRLQDFTSHVAAQKPVIIEANGRFHFDPITWKREIPLGSNSTSSSQVHVGQIRDLAKETFELVNTHGYSSIHNPVIAFFGTSRFAGGGRNTLKPRIHREIFKEGYYNWEELKFSTFQYERWLNSLDILANDGREHPDSRTAFQEAILTATPYIKTLHTDRKGEAIWLQLHDKSAPTLPLSYHSDGVITYVSMVAELAYRCIVLNNHLGAEAVRKSRGIVMIDELDLHLHPNWQKHVVDDLKNAFPKIQFVATTHSPFIVQSLSNEELINLDDLENTRSNEAPHNLPLNKVVTEVMQVNGIVSDNFEERYEKALATFTQLQQSGHTLVIDDYEKVQKLIDDVVEEETNDPVYKAFLAVTNDNA